MTGEYFSSLWAAIAPGVANHLWQSTLFAISAGSLTLVFRKHRARARYWLWLAASLKFLVPFSMLVAIGRYMAWPRSAASAPARIYYAIEDVTQPFGPSGPQVVPHLAPGTTSWTHVAPILLVLWFLGFLGVLALWII